MQHAPRQSARPEHAGQDTPQEIGATAGKTHEQILRDTLAPDVAARAVARKPAE